MIIELNNEELQFMPLEKLEKLLKHDQVTLQIPLPSINSTNSYIDIIWDYLDASFAIETLSNNFLVTKLSKIWDIENHPVYHVNIEGFNSNDLALFIKKIIWSCQYPEDQELEIDYINYREEINAYEGKVTEINLKHPDIIDDYLVNLINGAYYELEYEIIAGHLKHFPERHYGYFSGSKYNNSKEKVLFSTSSWIVPLTISLDEIFNDHKYEGKISLLPSNLLVVNQRTVAISELGVVKLPMGQLIQAVACYEEFLHSKDKYRHKLSLDGNFFQYSPETNKLYGKFSDFIKAPNLYKVFTSEFLDFCVVSTESAQIVLFDIEQINGNESKKFIDATKQLLSSLEDELVIDSDICVDWSRFDDELFEQLCYDIIYHSSKFDRNTIRKMGKSRSRDGGRDIVVLTRPIAAEKPRKYVFQCKFSKRESSINTSNVGSVSDVIDQYGAEGYGLMCNCYIDSTLFDRLDGISSNRRVEIETWSGFEIERFLSRRPLLKKRYEIT